MAAYIEPGAYAKVVETLTSVNGVAPLMTPLAMGSAVTMLATTEVVVRGDDATDSDALPRKAVSIHSVGFEKDKSSFTETTDYELSADKASIKWVVGGTKPTAGESYFISYSYEVDDTYYGPSLIYDISDIRRKIGNQLKLEEDGGGINRLAVAVEILLETGVSPVLALPVKPGTVSKKVDANQYKLAIENFVSFMDNAWRIIPVDLDDDINSVIDAHVKKMSDYLERKERCAIYCKKHDDFSDFSELLTSIGGYAEAKKSAKLITVYPDKATKLLEDGHYHELDAPFICAAIAGLQASQAIQQSMTKSSFSVFNELLGMPMLRSQMNAVAGKGVTLLEQKAGAGTPIVVRHALTTDMTTTQTKEPSVQAIEDFSKKYFREIAENYIGKYNITPDLITRLDASLKSGITALKQLNIILDAKVKRLAQDIDNPDSIILEIEIKVPYPCNYIMITIYAE